MREHRGLSRRSMALLRATVILHHIIHGMRTVSHLKARSIFIHNNRERGSGKHCSPKLFNKESSFIQLESVCSIPRCYFKSDREWKDDFYTVTEYSFAVRLSKNSKVNLSNEHSEINIIKYSDLKKYNTWDSNKTAAWELKERMLMGRI